ncbi:hypothetical protein [Sideroxydans lithotrophicus]|uniref:Uncharacterized protein n=1 Tax=Sideroxydans lithotrophicus (strain ES-1) TaxID=580332 RepID=D5CLQ2_SIDLE|nr:hypothetical protein [Sideroxydans lithotrophicus]ADE12497.1 hypothetical protein Slit_2269 [Sideroxydans lithotrophicus ES-1]
MATIVLDMDGCDIAHEQLMLEEYGEEVMSAGWIPPRTLKGENEVALAIAPVEPADTGEFFLSTAFPQCP